MYKIWKDRHSEVVIQMDKKFNNISFFTKLMVNKDRCELNEASRKLAACISMGLATIRTPRRGADPYWRWSKRG